MPGMRFSVALCAALAAFCWSAAVNALPTCLFIASYHADDAHTAGIERGLESVLNGRCNVQRIYMDGRRASRAQLEAAAAAARQAVESLAPDVVIAADDEAARHVIQPYYRDHAIPFVFTGVNWTVREYGFPYSNVTGMVEVEPIAKLLEQAMELTGARSSAFYLGADSPAEKHRLMRFRAAARVLRLRLKAHLAASMSDWERALTEARVHDFVVLGQAHAIRGWSAARAAAAARQVRRLSVTTHADMMPYTMFGMTGVPEEQGVWSAEAALSILSGRRPDEIRIAKNKQWDLWVNRNLLRKAGFRLPRSLRVQAKRVE